MKRVTPTNFKNGQRTGLTQLSLVEHALCPIDPRQSLGGSLVHEAAYRYTDAHGDRKTARAKIVSHAGLSPTDEFYLWGLLALSFAQQQPSSDFYATPHYCLRELGVIQQESKGGKSYRLFRESLSRLAGVRYENDRFFDPVRKEHRQVAFGLLGFSLPLEPTSSRAWRIVWDTQFFEFCQATGGRLLFDLSLYRRLDPASRRLMLLLQKVFYRRRQSPRLGLRELAVEVLGFSASLPSGKLKAKVERAGRVLVEAGVVAGAPRFERQGSEWRVRFERGPRWEASPPSIAPATSPLLEPLQKIGLAPTDAGRVLRRYQQAQVQLWSDVTLAAIESQGPNFFRRSPAAFLIDNLKAAARGERTPPDWFLATRKREELGRAPRARRRDQPASKSLSRAIQPSQNAVDVVRSLLHRATTGS